YLNKANENRKSDSKEAFDLEIWEGGFDVQDYEDTALRAFYADPEQVLRDYMGNKVELRRQAFVKQYQAKLMNDPETTTIPTKSDAMITLITGKPGYKNRTERDAEEQQI
ncbi:MAG: hypothetical protein ACTSPI_13710, partial [Candidatus Heimdallarchaeaceae archaeon]